MFTAYWQGKLRNVNQNSIVRTSNGQNYLIQIPYGTGNPGNLRIWYHKANNVYVQSGVCIPNEYYYDNLFHDFVFIRNGTICQLYIDGTQYGGNLTMASNEHLTYNCLFAPPYMFTPLTQIKIYSTVQTPANAKSGTPDVDWFLFLGSNCINILSNEILTPSLVGEDNAYYCAEASSWMLDHGYSLYKVTAGASYLREIYLPYKSDDTPSTIPTYYTTAGYELDSNHAGDSSNHNLADSMLNIPYSAWDRSNVSLWNALARVTNSTGRGRYDSTNPDAWHIEELDQIKLIAFGGSLNTRCYVKCDNNSHDDRVILKEIFSFDENLSKANIKNATQYSGDYSLLNQWPAIFRPISSVTVRTIWSSIWVESGTYNMYGVYGTFPNTLINRITSPDGFNWTEDTVNKPLLNFGAHGTWDHTMLYVPQVWKEGATWYMLYAGANADTGLLRQIGLATSVDGLTWSKYAGNPVYAHGAPGQWDDNTNHLDVEAVIKVGSTYYMFVTNGPGASTRKVGVAWSTDLINWTRDPQNPVFNPVSMGGVNNHYYCPGIFKQGSIYYMIITRRQGAVDSLELFSCPNPTFHEDERTFIKTTSTFTQLGLLALDTPFVVTDDINRDILKNNVIMCYYSPTAGGFVGLSVCGNLQFALTSL